MGSISSEVIDYEATRSFVLDVEGEDRRVVISEQFEVLFQSSHPQRFRCRATRGKWLEFNQWTQGYLNTHMKKIEPDKSPVHIDTVESYKATCSFDLVNGFLVGKGAILDVQLRNGTPRAIRKHEKDLWTVVWDELRIAIHKGQLLPEQEADPEIDRSKGVRYEVIKYFEVGNSAFQVGDTVWTDGKYIQATAGDYEELEAPFVAYMNNFEEIKADPAWLSAIVTKPFSLDYVEFPKDCLVEANLGDSLIRAKGANHEMPFDMTQAGEVLEFTSAVPVEPAVPATPADPVLEGEPFEVALALLPTIKEVFHWVPGHDWAMTAPMNGNPKVSIEGRLDYKWSLEIVLDVDESVALLIEDTTGGGDDFQERSRVILGTHCWADFVGWLSVAVGLAQHPVQVKGYKFLTTRPIKIGQNQWEAGQIISVINDKIDDQVRDLIFVGALVAFMESPILGCEGCWHARQGCTRVERWGDRAECEEWTLTEPPPQPPQQRYQSLCHDCTFSGDEKDKYGNIVKTCSESCDPYSTDDCLTFKFDPNQAALF